MAELSIDRRNSVNLDSDPAQPGVQISEATIKSFIAMPGEQVDHFVNTLDLPSTVALRLAVDKYAALQPTGTRVTYADVTLAAALAARKKAAPTTVPEAVAVRPGSKSTDVNVKWADGSTDHTFAIPKDFNLSVTRDNTLMLSRKDGATFDGPMFVECDHIIFAPIRTTSGVDFRVEASSVPAGRSIEGTFDEDNLNGYLHAIR